MDSPLNDSANPVATTIALSVGPAAAGAAVGMLIGETLDRSSRRAAAVTLLGLAALSVTPWLASLVKQRVTGPASKRGNARTLANIRDGGSGNSATRDTTSTTSKARNFPRKGIIPGSPAQNARQCPHVRAFGPVPSSAAAAPATRRRQAASTPAPRAPESW